MTTRGSPKLLHAAMHEFAGKQQILNGLAPLKASQDGGSRQLSTLRQRPHRSLPRSPCYSHPMTARILDGTKIRDEIFAELKQEVVQLTSLGVRPGLAAVLVGENPASQLYVKSKIAACEQLGMGSGLITPAASATTAELLAIVEDLNRDNDTDGILIQLPLPTQVDTKRVLEAVDPAKDVDGFHPVNLGR